MKNECQKEPRQRLNRYWNRYRIASMLACLVAFVAIAFIVIWLEFRFQSHERPEQPIESACSTSAWCSV